jgi:hypothetical protein
VKRNGRRLGFVWASDSQRRPTPATRR